MATGSGDGDGSRRLPQNMDGLLKFCLSASDDPAEGTSSSLETDPEKREWLKEVLESMSANDPIKELIEHVRRLQTSEDVVEKEEALDSIQEWCDDIDMAKDFHKIGGFSFIKDLLQNEHSSLRWRTANLLATLVQNNPYCQAAAIELGLLPVLLQMLDKDVDIMVQIKALYSLSCLTREFEQGQESFVNHDGFSVLLRAMQRNDTKLQTKAAFLLSSLCATQPQYKDLLSNMGMVEQLVALLSMEHSTSHEHLLSALLALVRNHDASIAECQRPELNLRSLLQRKIQELSGQEEFEEEVQYSKELLQLCFSHEKNDSTSVER